MLADDDVGADVGAAADAGGGSDDGGGVDAGFVAWSGVEELDGTGPGEIGVGGAEGGGFERGEAGFDDEGGGLGGVGLRGVLGVGDEGEGGGAGGFDARDSVDGALGCGLEGIALGCNQIGSEMLC